MDVSMMMAMITVMKIVIRTCFINERSPRFSPKILMGREVQYSLGIS